MVRLAVDFENAAPSWWEGGGRELWEGITEGFDPHSVVVEESLAHSWLAEASRLPGWEGGPDYAPHPIRLIAVADDDESF
ncbi:MAG: hypothetical protein ABFS46_04935 [Myxococcota bacterium]